MHLKETLTTVNDGRALELEMDAPERRAWRRKEATMWVFDGEQWTEEGGSAEQAPKSTQNQFDMEQYDMDRFLPELQVVEVVEIVPAVPAPAPSRVPFPLP
jgi:hypothetical protein